DRVLDLDPGDVLLRVTPAHDHVQRLAHVDTGIGGAIGAGVLDQYVARAHRVDAIRAISGLRPGRPRHAYPAYGDVLAVVDLKSVSLGAIDREILEREVTGIDQQALRS